MESVDIIPLGGVGEIGKNITAYRCREDIVVVDVGLMFPEEEMLGVDLVIPDFTFLRENAEQIRGIVLTHGHEDHIGALPYLLREIPAPVYATPLTLGLAWEKLRENDLEDKVPLFSVQPGHRVPLGCFEVEWIRVTHSIPDSCSLALHTPAGTILHTSDFKFDPTPIDGRLTDFARLALLGDEGVLALVTDSTNSEKPGHTPSERLVGETLSEIFQTAQGRIIIATFASNIHRIQQVFNIASRYGRRVAVIGRSMMENVCISRDLGYLEIAEGTWISVEEIPRFCSDEIVILTTGSQGEPLSALSRIAAEEHKRVRLEPGDTVIISAHPIPGNEDLVYRTINNLFRRGAEVIYEDLRPVHVSGHASREELMLMVNLARPQYIVPVHGEPRHLYHYAEMVYQLGYTPEQVFLLEIGDVLRISREEAKVVGRVPGGSVLVDGIGLGAVEDLVLRDRWHLSQDGVLITVTALDKETGEIVAGPDVIARGVIFTSEVEGIMETARQLVTEVVAETVQDTTEWSAITAQIKSRLSQFLRERTGKRPMILPVVLEV